MLLAVIGTAALWLTFLWLASAIVASVFAEHKGWGEKTGLMTGIVLSMIGAFVWAVWPAREVSRWKLHGRLGTAHLVTAAALIAIELAVGGVLLASSDTTGLGKLGLAVVVLMLGAITAAGVKSIAIVQTVGGKTLAELRAERDAVGSGQHPAPR